jgi:hypothetical protein
VVEDAQEQKARAFSDKKRDLCREGASGELRAYKEEKEKKSVILRPKN